MQEVIQENQEKDFLKNYEIKNWNFSPKLYKILAASAIFNVVALVVFAQSNLMTKKGCDSPFVGTVCQVLDTVYVGTKLFGTDSEKALREYNDTKIGENENIEDYDVTMIDVSDRLTYPAGYMAVANPDQYRIDEFGNVVRNDFNSFENMTPPNGMNPTMPPPAYSPPSLMNTPPSLPPTNNKPVVGNIPSDLYSINENPTVNNPPNNPTSPRNSRKGGKNPPINNDSPTELPKLDGDENPTKPKVDEKTADNSDPVKSVETNRKPIYDLTDFALAKWSANKDYKVELKPFKVVLDGKLVKKEVTDEKGETIEVVKFDPKKTSWNKKEESGDAEMIEVARQAVEKVGDSGFLGYLYNFGAENVQITLEQVDGKVIAVLKSDMKTEEKAKTMASGLNVFMAGAKLGLKGDDEKALMNSAKNPTFEGKFFIIGVEMNKDQAQEMIQRNLIEAAKRKQQQQQQKPNSTAQTVNSNINTGK